ncbi:hypothetical protein [Skermanella aerolata]|uniref:hypothetical protein n=1 Tax=Skermanella aerolata TaxID=393310 RepID=UPI001B3BE355|nr:hypothetical protein [Skermanella aerolata]
MFLARHNCRTPHAARRVCQQLIRQAQQLLDPLILLRHIERALAERGERVLLVETSSLPSFEHTRAFYSKSGYDEEARIRDFYQAGEDKVVFRKDLQDKDWSA